MVTYFQTLRQVHAEEINQYTSDPDRVYKIAARLNPIPVRNIMGKFGLDEVEAAKMWVHSLPSPDIKNP